jgi:hypothetical protein
LGRRSCGFTWHCRQSQEAREEDYQAGMEDVLSDDSGDGKVEFCRIHIIAVRNGRQ